MEKLHILGKWYTFRGVLLYLPPGIQLQQKGHDTLEIYSARGKTRRN